MTPLLDPALLQLLQCPRCGEALGQPQGDALACLGCQHWFPVRQGIAILLPEAASPTPLAPGDTTLPAVLVRRYWDSPAMAALYDQKVEGEADPLGVYTHLSERHAMVTLYRHLGRVLDAGCGNGRFLADLPAESLTVGADASFHLLTLARQKGRGRYHVCCALEHLPFRENAFDTVLSCRVLQHLEEQQRAVTEMARVTRPGGDVILQVYNIWNLKTLYKAIRQSPLHKIFNAPFRLLFRSMSPFAPWGLDHDRYNRWGQLRRWMVQAGLGGITGRGAGLGYHKYLLVPFYLDAAWKNHAPGLRAAYYDACLAWEKRWGGRFPCTRLLEKFTLRGEKGGATVLPLSHKIVKTLAHHGHELRNWPARLEQHRERQATPTDQNRPHLTAALAWLCRAQDITACGGVSRGYAMGWVDHFHARGWQPAYPETTGYLIPTFFEAARHLGDAHLAQRALAMADWERAVQLPNGAVMSGTVDRPPQPAVFNTGQVILGWVRALQESGRQEYGEAALRAAAFLLRHQDEDGGWSRHNSPFAHPGHTTYNSRVGWSLVELGVATGDKTLVAAGERNIRHTLNRQSANGWFRDNCLSDPRTPLTHTICYATEGIMGAATLLPHQEWRHKALLTLHALCRCVTPAGRLPGRLDDQWQGTVPWDCLTGNAQLAALLLAWHCHTPTPFFQQTALRLLQFLKKSQNITTRHSGLRGGIKGSFPFSGEYGRFQLLNWPAKFFVDALLLAESIPTPHDF